MSEITIEAEKPFEFLKDDPLHCTVHHPYSAFNQGYHAGSRSLKGDNPYRGKVNYWADWWEEGRKLGVSEPSPNQG